MNKLNLEQAKRMRGLAQFYYAFDCNILPLDGEKRPPITGLLPNGKTARLQWQDWEATRQPEFIFRKLLAPTWWTNVYGIALICGKGSQHLAVIDIDALRKHDPTAPAIHEAFITEILTQLALPIDYAWQWPTPTGGHAIALRCPDLQLNKANYDRPSKAEGVDHIELRFTGSYVVAPGSRHPMGTEYQWARAEPVSPPAIVNTITLLDTYYRITVDPPQKTKTMAVSQPPLKPPTGDAPAPTAGDLVAYVAKAVTEECDAVAQAAQGGRNERLNEAAFALGTLIGAGVLDRFDAENALFDAAMSAGLGEGETQATIASGLNAGVQHPRTLPESTLRPRSNGYTPDLDVTSEDAQAFLDEGGEPVEHNPWPYAEYDGRMVYCVEKGDELVRYPIADFVARNVEEIIDEDGSKTIAIAGYARRGGAFRVCVSGATFGEDRILRAALEQAAGARDPVHHRMSGHLAPAIKKLTRDSELTVVRRFLRTGWHAGQFLLPGMTGDASITIELPPKLPYGVPADADEAQGLAALADLAAAIDPTCTTPMLTMLLQAPLQRRVRWRKRYGAFIQGRTGSLKTSWAQAAMAIYGEGFLDDAHLLKWGEGATRNAVMTLATAVHDLPLLIDNYKPNTGDGKDGFTALIHNIIEGGNKERTRRDGTLLPSAVIHAWPLCTGEDVPEHDSASLARLFVVVFPWQAGQPNLALTRAQAAGHHLPAVGRLWLQWIASDDGATVIEEISTHFEEARTRWTAFIQSIRLDTGNPLRIAENLATNELTWRIACRHPQIGPVLLPHSAAHTAGLRTIAERMAESTAEALEAHQFLSTVRELLAAKQYTLIPRQVGVPPDYEAGNVLGWYDAGGVYLLPAMALAAARKVQGPGSIPISARALNDQLDRLGLLLPGSDKKQKMIRIGERTVRVMHLSLEAFGDDDGEALSLLQNLGI